MPAPLQIGITGGIGSGKSLVSRIFSVLGIPVYDADSRAKAIMTTDGIVVSSIKKEFGDSAFHSDGKLNRQYLADEVFNNEEKLQRLNSLVHPRVGADYNQWLTENSSAAYVLKEAALLFESGSWQTLDKIIVVSSPEEVRIQRVLKRDPHRTMKQVQEIIRNQMNEDEKRGRADFVIVNDESRLIIPQVLELHQRFLSMN